MNFLKTLLWILIAAGLAIFATANWTDATIKLWGGLLVTIKLPFLLLIAFLAGWLPTWLVMRGKLWRLKRLGADGHAGTPVPPPPPASVAEEQAEERL
jgi:uncharacterized integral membrane protein